MSLHGLTAHRVGFVKGCLQPLGRTHASVRRIRAEHVVLTAAFDATVQTFSAQREQRMNAKRKHLIMDQWIIVLWHSSEEDNTDRITDKTTNP